MVDKEALLDWLEAHGLERHWLRAKPIHIIRKPIGGDRVISYAEFVVAAKIHARSGDVIRYGEEDHVEMPLFCSEEQVFAWIREHGIDVEDVTADGITLHASAGDGPTVVEFTVLLRDEHGNRFIVDGDELARSRPAMLARSLPPLPDRALALAGA